MIKNFLRAYIRFVQKILITIFLAVLYVFGVGLTAFAAFLMRVDAKPFGATRGKNFWMVAEGHDPGIENAKKPF